MRDHVKFMVDEVSMGQSFSEHINLPLLSFHQRSIFIHLSPTLYIFYTDNHKKEAAIYVQLNTEAPSCNHCCSGKAISITYSEYVYLALGIQHAMHTRHIVTCGLPNSTKFFTHCLKKGRFSKRSN
jgi:hypothetical protein